MAARKESKPRPMKNPTTVERKSDRELVVTRTFDAPAHVVFEAWTKPDLFKRWWAVKSMGMSLTSCELDVRVGGGYRLVFNNGMAFFGKYIEVTPPSRLVWTNDEGGAAGPVTTVTFEEKGGKTLLVMHGSIPQRKLSTLPAPERRKGWPSCSNNWTSFSSRSARAEHEHAASS